MSEKQRCCCHRFRKISSPINIRIYRDTPRRRSRRRVEKMTKRGANSGIPQPSSVRDLDLAGRSSEDARRSARLRLQILRKPKVIQTKKVAQLKGKNMPKKPPTAFFYFLKDFRKLYKELNPEVTSMREIGKTCGEKWKTMTYEEKVKYYDIATEKREEFHRAMTEYTKKMESGEYDESGTESDVSE